MRVEITFVRHGESESNVTGHWQGQGDSPLSAHGREQAQALASRLAATPYDIVVASDLSRARDTGLAVSSRWHHELQTDPRWREIDVGAWEGLTRPQVFARFPGEIAALSRGEMIPIGGTGESWAELAKRGDAALDELRHSMSSGQRAIVFSHGGLIASVVAKRFGLSLRKPRRLGNVNNTAITTLRFEGDSCRLVRYNDTLHLGPVGKWSTERLKHGCAVVALHVDKPPAQYPTPRTNLRLAELGLSAVDALANIAAEHPGERVGLEVSAEVHAALGAELLAPETVGSPRGVTHIVASADGHTLAELNCIH